MAGKARLLKNTIALSAPDAINPFVSFALILVISRCLGAEGLGEYSLVLAWQALFVTVASMGLGVLIIRETSRKPETINSYFFNSLILGSVSSSLAMIGMITTFDMMGYPERVIWAGAISSLSLIPSTAIRYIEAVFRSLEKSEYPAFCYMAENIVRVFLSIGLLLMGFDLLWIFSAITLVNYITLCLMIYFYVRIVGRPRWSLDWAIWGLMAKHSPTFLGIAIFSTMYINMPQIMLSKLLDIPSVGIFSSASRIISFASVIPIGFCMALLPAMTKKYEKGLDDLRRMTTDSLRYGFIFLFPIVVGTATLADQIIQSVYGSKFESAHSILAILAFGMPPHFILVSLAQVLVSTDNQKLDVRINLLAVSVSFLFHILLVPLLDVMGSVAAIMLSLAIINTAQYSLIRKKLFSIDFGAITWRPLIASAGMLPVTIWLRDNNLVFNIVCSAIVYVISIILIGGITREEISNLINALRKKLISGGN